MSKKQLWYVKRNGRIRGPFTAGLIRRNILLGAVNDHDELSSDRITWCSPSLLPELMPEVMQPHEEDLGVQEEGLESARRWADQRSGGDRRKEGAVSDDSFKLKRRSDDDRRCHEPSTVLHYRRARNRLLGAGRRRSESVRPALIVVATIALLVASYLLFYQPPLESDTASCEAPPRPKVN